jgi:hypothetical protein
MSMATPKVGLAGALLMFVAAAASAQAGAGPAGSPTSGTDGVTSAGTTTAGQLPSNFSCSQMKERISSVQGNTTAASSGAEGGRTSTNRSGNTARTDTARHEIAAGDAACAKGDREAARIHYQRAIDQLTARE